MISFNQIPFTYRTSLYYLIHFTSPIRKGLSKSRNNKNKVELLLLVVVVLSILCSSCITRRACERRFPPITYDSVSVVMNTVTIYRDTTIYVHLPGDTVDQSIRVDEGISELRTPNAKSYAWVINGILKHKLEQRDTAILQNIRGALKTTITDQQKDKTTEKLKFLNKLTNWQIFQIYLGRVLMFFAITILCWLIIKRIA